MIHTHTKNLLYLLQFWLVLEILVFCVGSQFSLVSLSLENCHISYKRDLLIFDSLQLLFAWKAFISPFLNTVSLCTDFEEWEVFFFFSLSAFETNLLARLVSDETAAVVLTFFSVCKLPLLSGLSRQCQPPLNCPEWSHTSAITPEPASLEHSCTVGSPSFVT